MSIIQYPLLPDNTYLHQKFPNVWSYQNPRIIYWSINKHKKPKIGTRKYKKVAISKLTFMPESNSSLLNNSRDSRLLGRLKAAKYYD